MVDLAFRKATSGDIREIQCALQGNNHVDHVNYDLITSKNTETLSLVALWKDRIVGVIQAKEEKPQEAANLKISPPVFLPFLLTLAEKQLNQDEITSVEQGDQDVLSPESLIKTEFCNAVIIEALQNRPHIKTYSIDHLSPQKIDVLKDILKQQKIGL